MRLVYHHFTQPSSTNAGLYRALKPGGRLAIIEYAPGGLWNFFAHWGHTTAPARLVQEVTDVAEHQAFLDGPYICPHRYAVPCACKKTGGALYRRAAAELQIDLASSFVVGDSLDDMKAARLLGCRSVLVRTGWQVTPEVEDLRYHIAEDVLAASHWIVASHMSGPTTIRP